MPTSAPEEAKEEKEKREGEEEAAQRLRLRAGGRPRSEAAGGRAGFALARGPAARAAGEPRPRRAAGRAGRHGGASRSPRALAAAQGGG